MLVIQYYTSTNCHLYRKTSRPRGNEITFLNAKALKIFLSMLSVIIDYFYLIGKANTTKILHDIINCCNDTDIVAAVRYFTNILVKIILVELKKIFHLES